MNQTRFSLSVGVTLLSAAMAAFVSVRIGAAVNTSPTVTVVRISNVKNQTWPGDFNGDGVLDLATTGNPDARGNGLVSVLLGDGHGGFTAAAQTGVRATGTILGVGDFDNNGRLDLIVATRATVTTVSILPGLGNGTFDTPFLVDSFQNAVFALSADIDGDGNRDLAINESGSNQVFVYPGTGNLQFGSRVALAAGPTPSRGVIADFNGDGRNDIAIANLEGKSVSFFLNQGDLTFASSVLELDRFATDAAAADLNGDGKLDLIVSAANGTLAGAFGQEFSDGVAYVLAGNGDGTFGAPVAYPVARGAYRVVVGDFTRDGILDIATGNRSTIFVDDCGPGAKTWDSVSILPGTGNGTFAAASSFSVADQQRVDSTAYRNTLSSLNASDVDGDHATDLIVSDGVIFKNHPADPNWAPSVMVGSTTPLPGDRSITLNAPAADSDQDMLTYAWIDSGGTVIAPVPKPCIAPATAGNHTFTVTVNDQHGHTASASVTVDLGGGSYKPPAAVITSPALGEIVRSAAPYTIRWRLTPGSNPVTRIDAQSSVGGAPAVAIAECTNLPPSATSCIWNSPGPVGDMAQVSLNLIDSVSIATAISGPFSIREASPDNTLPPPWLDQDIDGVGAAGDAIFHDGIFSVNGSGADIWGTSDAFHFAYQPLPLQFEAVTHVDKIFSVNAWTKVGLMVRTSLAADASQASIFVTGGNGTVFQRRLMNGVSVSTHGPALAAPLWLRLTGLNGRISAYVRKSASDAWTLVGSEALSNYDAAYVGMAVTSHAYGTLAGAQFSQVVAQPLPANATVDNALIKPQ